MVEVVQYFDSVSICLSKGLGAPIGSLLLGSTELIAQARRWRKVLGGGMRQTGLLAVAAKMALTENVTKLAEDHDNAKYLAKQLNNIMGFNVDLSTVETNMVYVKLSERINITQLVEELNQQNILISAGNPMRLVPHLDISKDDIDVFIQSLSNLIKVN